MTTQEFKAEYDKLAKVYPYEFGNEYKEIAIYSHIKDLDKSWWVKLVNRIILSANPKLDIADAANGERRARKSLADTRAMLNLADQLGHHISENGLDEALKAFGAKSLTEAIFSKKETAS